MSEPTRDQLKSQIRRAVKKYQEIDPKAAMLSGMSLVATFLAKLDGSKTMTAAVVLSVVNDIAKEMDFEVGKI